MIKVCIKCMEEKNINEFHLNSASCDKHRNICKKCTSIIDQDRRAEKYKNEKNLNSKFCNNCNKQKIVTEFYIDKSHNDGFSSSCKVCFNLNKTNTQQKYTLEFQQSQRKNLNGKICTKCKFFKTWENFTESKSTPTGKSSKCKKCAGKIQKEIRLKHIDKRNKFDSTLMNPNEYISILPNSVNPFLKALSGAAKRAKKNHIEFSITASDLLPLPLICPLLNIPLYYTQNNASDNTPSIDKIDPTKGYTKDNVWIVSNKANRVKSDINISELTLLLNNLNKKLKI